MWRDRWVVTGLLGFVLACAACLTPAAVLALGALGLAAWTGYVDVVALPLLAVFLGVAVLRLRHHARRARTAPPG